MTPPRKYVLCPGVVTSESDGQWHYIGAARLARLYGVSLGECEVWNDRFHENTSLTVLAPRYDGNYQLPR